MPIICTAVTNWITQQVVVPMSKWVNQQQQQCRNRAWPLNWICWIVTIVVQIIIWITQTMFIPIIQVICKSIVLLDMWATNIWAWVSNTVVPVNCNIEENPLEKEGWRLTFHDEFLGSTLDINKWRTLPIWTNASLPFHPGNIADKNLPPTTYWDDTSIYLSNSILTIETTNIPKSFPVQINNINYGTWRIDYKSGYIETKNFKQKYGYFEIRCRIPNSDGAWPAFWLANAPTWPPEIDIFEFYTSKIYSNLKKSKRKRYETTVHWGIDKDPINPRTKSTKVHKICDASDNFNVYTLEWSSKYIKFYFNNRLVRKEVKNMEEYKYPLDVIVSNSMEDYFTDPSVLNSMQLPHKFEVDYVRVYEKI